MDHDPLIPIGWRPHFQSQLNADEGTTLEPLRITEVQRSVLFATGAAGRCTLHLPTHERWSEALTVGDWVLARAQGTQRYLVRVLARENGLQRKAAGPGVAAQWLAANVDHAFLLSACDADFSTNRLERYLALAMDGGVLPVIVLTKADQCADTAALLARLPPGHAAVAVDARSAAQVAALAPWLRPGTTTALLGSSGVGKSTLTNTLLGEQRQQTRAVREDDARGRHTTTARHLLALSNGAWLIDTPGMRELQLPGVDDAMTTLFADVDALAARCRFADCRHEREPGCAVRAAVASGGLAQRRLDHYHRMQREQATHGIALRQHTQVTARRRQVPKGGHAKSRSEDRRPHAPDDGSDDA
jgi:ribosome biogenesis GTPase